MSTIEQNRSVTTSGKLVSDADYMQLSRLVIEHTYRADNGMSDTLHEFYAEVGELDFGGPEPLRGREAIAEWGRQLIENTPWNTTRHVCGNMHFVYDGPDAAIGTTILTVFMDADGTKNSVPWNVGEDQDRYVRTEQGWRIASRRWVELFARGDRVTIP